MEFIDINAQYKAQKAEIDKAMQAVLDNGQFIMGPDVKLFEQELADYLGVNHAISCANGTDALQLIYMALGIGKGDAIFVPDMTFIATHEPACMLGAEAIFCDIDPVSFNICPASLEKQIQRVLQDGLYTPKCIVGVDFLGAPCDWDALTKIANTYGLYLIEDAAQAIGATYKGKKCGSFGIAAATSFFPTKPLGCYGDGGAVFTNDAALAQVLISLRTHGKGTSKYDNVRIGVNSRLDTLQAAVLRVKLSHLEEEIALRHDVAQRYQTALCEKFETVSENTFCRNAYAQYVLFATDTADRQVCINAMSRQNVPSLLYYPTPMHQLPVFSGSYGGTGVFPNAEEYAARHFCLPFSPYLTLEEQNKVIAALCGEQL